MADHPPNQRPLLHDSRFGRELALTRICIVFTVATALVLTWALTGWMGAAPSESAPRLEHGMLALGTALLVYGSLVYQVARLGYLHQRRRVMTPVRDRLSPDDEQGDEPPALTALIPSYREDPHLVHMTVLSAALQEYARQRVVLLIDDPPRPTQRDHAEALHAVRRIPERVQDELAGPAARFADACERVRSLSTTRIDLPEETRWAAGLVDEAAAWFETQADRWPRDTHIDRFFVSQVLQAPAGELRGLAGTLRRRAEHDPLDVQALLRVCRRLVSHFDGTVTSFERKQYANLPHAPNKAMNINAYVNLMGGAYHPTASPDGDILERVPAGHTPREALSEPMADYLLILDADSMLLPGYARTLTAVAEAPGNERIAVVQTPYRAYPGAANAVERVAGATTDIMHRVHLGMSHYGAGFWVGANALVRTAALAEIATSTEDDGATVTRYIPDRTLIEDTEASLDLAAKGWRILSYPVDLAYSATPADYGSLVIQRRRWANGGLLLIPKLFRHAASLRPHRAGTSWSRAAGEVAMRLHYLISIASVNLVVVAFLTYPFQPMPHVVWVAAAATALPYFGLYMRDLAQLGYRRRDLANVYALNILLVPINLAGVAQSLRQAWTGRSSVFRRTPTFALHTATAPHRHVITLGFLAVWATNAVLGIGVDHPGRVLLTAAHAATLAYAVTRFIGWTNLATDLGLIGPPHPPGLVHRQRSVRWSTLPAACLVILIALPAAATSQIDQVEVTNLSSGSGNDANLLIVGVDDRESLTPEQRQQWSTGDFEGANADAIVVMSMDPDSNAALSFPRDLHVTRCDGTDGGIGAAYGIDGPECLVDTIHAFSGIPITHYVEVDMAGLVDFVDALGGVPMTLDEPIVDRRAGAALPAGTQRLTGEDALAFVRVREIDDDLGRISRQQVFLDALTDEVAAKTTMSDPARMVSTAYAAMSAVRVDHAAGLKDLVRIQREMTAMTDTHVVPNQEQTADGRPVLMPVDDEAQRLFSWFRGDSAHTARS